MLQAAVLGLVWWQMEFTEKNIEDLKGLVSTEFHLSRP